LALVRLDLRDQAAHVLDEGVGVGELLLLERALRRHGGDPGLADLAREGLPFADHRGGGVGLLGRRAWPPATCSCSSERCVDTAATRVWLTSRARCCHSRTTAGAVLACSCM